MLTFDIYKKKKKNTTSRINHSCHRIFFRNQIFTMKRFKNSFRIKTIVRVRITSEKRNITYKNENTRNNFVINLFISFKRNLGLIGVSYRRNPLFSRFSHNNTTNKFT